MGRLIDQQKRTQARRAGQEHRRAILLAAGQVFRQQPYSQVSLEVVGRAAGTPEGAASLYFATKADLLVHVLSDEVSAWCEALEADLARAGTGLDAHALATILAASLAGHEGLTRLLALLPVALEESLDVAAVDHFGAALGDRLARLAERLEACSPGLRPGHAAWLLGRLFVLVAGIEPLAHPRGGVSLALHGSGLGMLSWDFEGDLREMLEAILSRRGASPS